MSDKPADVSAYLRPEFDAANARLQNDLDSGHDAAHDDLDRGLRDTYTPAAYDWGAAEHRRDVLDAKFAGGV